MSDRLDVPPTPTGVVPEGSLQGEAGPTQPTSDLGYDLSNLETLSTRDTPKNAVPAPAYNDNQVFEYEREEVDALRREIDNGEGELITDVELRNAWRDFSGDWCAHWLMWSDGMRGCFLAWLINQRHSLRSRLETVSAERDTLIAGPYEAKPCRSHWHVFAWREEIMTNAGSVLDEATAKAEAARLNAEHKQNLDVLREENATLSASLVAEREKGERLAEDDQTLRMGWWLSHGCSVATLYGDDGEMSCGACGIDFKRMRARDIETRLKNVRMMRRQSALGGTDTEVTNG